MTLAVDSVCEIRNGGSDTLCAGWFADSLKGATGVDYTLQTAAQVTCSATLSAAGTTTLTATGSPFDNTLLGNTIRISGGTLTAGLYQITGYTDANNVVLDRTAGTGSGSTGYVGGAINSIGMASGDMASSAGTAIYGLGIYVKADATVTITSSSASVTNGRLVMPIGRALRPSFLVGYDTNRTIYNTDSSRPTITTGMNNAGNWVTYTTKCVVRNIIFDGKRATYTSANRAITYSSASGALVQDCKFKSFLNNQQGNGATFDGCEFTDNSTTCLDGTAFETYVKRCVFHLNTATCILHAYNGAYTNTIEDCLFYGNTGASTDAIELRNNNYSMVVKRCTFYNNGRHGVWWRGDTGTGSPTYGSTSIIENNIFVDNGGYGIGVSTATSLPLVRNNAFYSNTSGEVESNLSSDCVKNSITLTGDPFTNSGSGDFSLNSTVGAGAACKAVAYTTFPLGLTTSYNDVGAAQHQEIQRGVIF